jgi:hypothetical protein
MICVYFELKKMHHYSIILNFVIQSYSIARGYKLVFCIFGAAAVKARPVHMSWLDLFVQCLIFQVARGLGLGP